MLNPKKEAEVKKDVGNWLRKHGCEVYDEKESSVRPHWDGYFQVENISRTRKPDIVIGCHLTAEGEAENRTEVNFVALEIKPGHKHKEIADGFSDVLGYFADYCWGTTYFVKRRGHPRRQVTISVFALATRFSPQGFLYEGEKQFGRKPIKETRRGRRFYPITFFFSRLLGAQKTSILNNIMGLAEIPGAKKRVRRGLRTRENLPQVGVLTKNSRKSRGVLLMTSESPFYWNITRVKHDEH